LTFDADVLAAGSPKSAVDQALGKPVKKLPSESGSVFEYTSGRVDESAKQALVAGNEFVGLLTLGASEIASPLKLFESESKTFQVTFDENDKVVAVNASCDAGYKKGHIRPFYKGMTCSQ
jgi:hypothetical protein